MPEATGFPAVARAFNSEGARTLARDRLSIPAVETGRRAYCGRI